MGAARRPAKEILRIGLRTAFMRWSVRRYSLACGLALVCGLALGMLPGWLRSDAPAPYLRHAEDRVGVAALRPALRDPGPPALRESIRDMAPAAPILRQVASEEGAALRRVDEAALSRPLIAIVIDDLGLDLHRAVEVIELDAPLTVAILPYGRYAQATADLALRNGHEVLLHLPMQPDGTEDPGPNALLMDLNEWEFKRRLEWDFSQFTGFTGFNNHMGSRLTRSPTAMGWIMAAARRRGLFFVDSITVRGSVSPDVAREAGVPFVRRDVFLDHARGATAVEHQLETLEQLARMQGTAVAIGHPHPQTIARLRDWIAAAPQKGFRLVPVSTVLARRTAPVMLALRRSADGAQQN